MITDERISSAVLENNYYFFLAQKITLITVQNLNSETGFFSPNYFLTNKKKLNILGILKFGCIKKKKNNDH